MVGSTRDEMFSPDDETPVYVISVAAQLAGMHAQTLRQYDRLGLVTPARTRGGGRRYSAGDVGRLREIQRLSQEEGVSLPGIRQIIALQSRIRELSDEVETLSREVEAARAQRDHARRVFAATNSGDVIAVRAGQRPRRQSAASRALVLWRPGADRG